MAPPRRLMPSGKGGEAVGFLQSKTFVSILGALVVVLAVLASRCFANCGGADSGMALLVSKVDSSLRGAVDTLHAAALGSAAASQPPVASAGSGPDSTKPSGPQLLLEPWVETPGCDINKLTSKPFSVTWHTNPSYFMAAYGPEDYISARSTPGSDTFFEQGASHFFAKTLRDISLRRKSKKDPRPVWFLDVGANVGVHSLAVAATGIPVISVEGYPTTAARLACSKTLNKFDHMIVVPNAITPAAAPVCFAVRDEVNQGMNWLDSNSAATSACPPAMLAQGRTLSDILTRIQPKNLPPPAVVKVDIEGSELKMLKGFAPHLDGEHLGSAVERAQVPDLMVAWPEAPAESDRHKWRPDLFVFELRPELLATHDSASVQDVVVFMASYGYRAFFADFVGELTEVADRNAFDATAAYNKIHGEKTCPNYSFLRNDLDPADYANPMGCLDRRRML